MQTLTATDIKALYAEAMKAQGEGRLEQALQVYGRIIAANPKLPEVHYQVGRIYIGADRADRALPHLAAAAALKPAEPAIWLAWADAVALAESAAAEPEFLARLKASSAPAEQKVILQDRFGRFRTKSRPNTGRVPPDEVNRLIAYLGAGRHAEAEVLAEALLRQHGPSGMVQNILAGAQAYQKKSEKALQNFARTHQSDPGNAEAWANHGILLLELRRNKEAADALRRAVALAPGKVDARASLGLALVRSGESALAIPYLNRTLREVPDHALGLLALGNAYTRLREYEKAIEPLLKISGQPGAYQAEAASLLGQAQSRVGSDDAAMASYDKALSVNPDLPLAVGGKAALLQTLGDFDEADRYFRRSFELDPGNGENYRLYIASHKTKPDDPVIGAMAAQFARPDLSDMDRMNFGFALAKAYEDVGEYDRVFRYLDEANALMRKAFPYDVATRKKEIDRAIAFYDAFDPAVMRVEGTTDFAPIFVTGMPRSGTTLIEQIISSHSTVTGAGEVGEASKIIGRLLAGPNDTHRQIAEIAPAEIAAAGHEYERYMRGLFPEADRMTDKSIQTYVHLGLIRVAMPRARVVVVRRDPRDNLLSIYKNKFVDGTHGYAYNLRDLGIYYRQFVRMIDYWREKMPGWFYEVDYDSLVANPEEESRKLIAACGLEWEDACLSFHENRRKVQTLSVFQVRQPIYKSSVKGWQRYENEMAELIAELEKE